MVAARVLADVGDVTRFADRNRFASWTGTAPLDASSGEQNRHRLSRAGNRRMNHMIHIAAVTQIRLDTEGRAYYRRKRADGKKPMEAMRCLKRRISDAIYRQLLADAHPRQQARTREGTAGRLKNPARSTCPRTSTLRISHFPDPQTRRYAPSQQIERALEIQFQLVVDNRREPERRNHAIGRGRHAPATWMSVTGCGCRRSVRPAAGL